MGVQSKSDVAGKKKKEPLCTQANHNALKRLLHFTTKKSLSYLKNVNINIIQLIF